MPLPNIEGVKDKLLQKLMSLFLPLGPQQGSTKVGNYPIYYKSMNVAGKSLPGGSIILDPDMGNSNEEKILRHENAHSIVGSLPIRTWFKNIYNEQDQKILKDAYLGSESSGYTEDRPDNILANIEGPAILASDYAQLPYDYRYDMLSKIIPELYSMDPMKGDQYIENLPPTLKKSIRPINLPKDYFDKTKSFSLKDWKRR